MKQNNRKKKKNMFIGKRRKWFFLRSAELRNTTAKSHKRNNFDSRKNKFNEMFSTFSSFLPFFMFYVYFFFVAIEFQYFIQQMGNWLTTLNSLFLNLLAHSNPTKKSPHPQWNSSRFQFLLFSLTFPIIMCMIPFFC